MKRTEKWLAIGIAALLLAFAGVAAGSPVLPKTDANDGLNGDNPYFQRWNVARAHTDSTDSFWYTSNYQIVGEPDPSGDQWVDYRPPLNILGTGFYQITATYRQTSSRASYDVQYVVHHVGGTTTINRTHFGYGDTDVTFILGEFDLGTTGWVRVNDTGAGSITFGDIKFTYLGSSQDTQPPSVPTNVQATPQSTPSSSSIVVTWTASTDNIGVTGYKIHRDGSQVGTTSSTSYTDIGLQAETTYSYTVSAYDGAGNESAQSSPPATATTPPEGAKIYPNDDTYTRSGGYAGNNYDGQGLLVKSQTGDYTRYSWLEFTFGSSPVEYATLDMYQLSTWSDGNYGARFYGAEYSIDETSLTWNSQPSVSTWTNLGGWTAILGAREWYTLDITSFYNSKLGKTVTLRMNVTTSGSNYGGTYEDREGSQGTTNYPMVRHNGDYYAGPTITSHLDDQTKCTGESVTFSVTATGSPPLSYQWRKNEGNIGGANSSSYTINPVLAESAGSYDCVVSNSYGSATSNAAALTVKITALITSQPQSQTKCVGGSVTFSVSVSGTTPLSYQWRKNGGSISGADWFTYTINPVSTGDAGSYDCVASNPCGTATSNAATLTITQTPPSITGQPQSQTRCVGSSVTFSVTASGADPLTYQWRKNGGNISGASSSSYTINPISAGDAGSYDCVVSHSCGSATSNAATLTIAQTAPSITSHPQSQTKCVSNSVTFSVTASGADPLSYQWRKNSSNISGATSSSYTISSVSTGSAGSYDCVVSDSCGSATSNAAALTVQTAPSITSNPSSRTRCVGTSVTFSVSASGTTPLSYQWRKNSSSISGATSSSYTINPVSAGDAGSYNCVVSNSCGSATSNTATLTVRTAPSITAQPQSQTKCVGGSVTFSVTASGTATLTYQWRKNSSNISGATSSSYTINPVSTGNAGSYDCVVSNSCGSATSNAATLTIVETAPSITGQPQSQAKCVGNSVTFSVSASGNALSYLWRKNSSSISGATSSSYTINPVSTEDAGSYDCVVSNSCGSAISNPATFTPMAATGDIAAAKMMANTSPVCLGSKVVTALFDDCFYIEETDRSAGIKVAPAAMPPGIAVGKTVDVGGVIRTDGGERYIEAETVIVM